MSDRDDSIAALLALPSSEWSIDSTREALFAALYRLKLANELIHEQESLIAEQKELTESLKGCNEQLGLNIRILSELLTLTTSVAQPQGVPDGVEKKSRGRPKKDSKRDLSWVCDWYENAISTLGKRSSDTALIKAWLAAQGLSQPKISSLQSQINTFRTEYLTPAKGTLEAKWRGEGKSLSRK